MSKLEAKAQERNESCDRSSQNAQDTQNNEDKNAKVIDEKHQKASCGFKSIAGIESWGVKTGGREWAEND